MLEHARAKRLKKGVPMLVANDVSVAMGKTTNQIIIIDNEREVSLPESGKDEAAAAIVSRLAELLGAR